MVMAAFGRHPRYILILLVILATSTFILFPVNVPLAVPHSVAVYLPSKYRGISLEEFVHQEELSYAKVVKGRQELIRQYGPLPGQVDPFPPGSIFYTLWDFFLAAFNCPHRIERLGALGDGGKWLCGVDRLATQHTPCVVYSFGVNHDSSFEADLLQRAPNCQVWGYDFSVTEFGPEIMKSNLTTPEGTNDLQSRSHFFQYALGPHNKPESTPPVYTIQSLMAQNGHTFIDVLKIDIEGGEFDALDSFFSLYDSPEKPNLPVGQMEIEIHAWANNGEFNKFLTWWERMERAGLRPFWTEPNLPYVSHLRTRPDLAEYSFINVRGKHSIITDYY